MSQYQNTNHECSLKQSLNVSSSTNQFGCHRPIAKNIKNTCGYTSKSSTKTNYNKMKNINKKNDNDNKRNNNNNNNNNRNTRKQSQNKSK